MRYIVLEIWQNAGEVIIDVYKISSVDKRHNEL